MANNKWIISMAVALSWGTMAMGQGSYKALKFKTATSLYNYEMLPVHAQGLERVQTFGKAVQSKEAMQEYVRNLRARFIQLAGELPQRGKLNAKVVGTMKGEGFVVEKIVFQSTPGRYVTAHLYLPEKIQGRIPACIEMCGHGLDGKGTGSGSAEQLAVNGIASMVVDPFGQGERQQTIDGDGKNLTRGVTTEHTLIAPAFLLLGSSLAAQEFFDNSRAIDYLLTRREIDGSKIGCYGFSGGGTQSAYLAALDERVQASCVGLFFSSRERTLETQGPSDGCQWMPGEGREHIEIADMVMMNAPKPFLILDGRFDFVDHWGALQGFDELKQCYSVLGAPDAVEQFYYDDGHAIPKESQDKMVSFFRKALLGDASGKVLPYAYWRSDNMRCTKAGQVNLEFADARSSMQECEAKMDDLAGKRAAFCAQPLATVQKGILQLLGLSSLKDKLEAVETKHESLRDVEEYRYQLNSEGEYPLPVIVRIPSSASAQSEVCIHLLDAGKASGLLEVDRRDLFSDGTIHVYADLRGFGETADIFEYNLSKYWNNQYRSAVTALHAGKPLLGQRVQDLHTLLNFCSSADRLKNHAIRIEADGMNGVVVMHTAVLDERIGKATLTKTLKSWRNYIQQPIQHEMMPNVLPGVLRYYDIPDLLSLARGRVVIED